eukprot:jgi/Mesvir1/12624/Mv09321-RA.1
MIVEEFNDEEEFADKPQAKRTLLDVDGAASSWVSSPIMAKATTSVVTAQEVATPWDYVYMLDMPGVAKEDVDVRINTETRLMTINARAEMSKHKNVFNDNVAQSWHKYTCEIKLPADASFQGVTATCDANGITHIKLRKKTEAGIGSRIGNMVRRFSGRKDGGKPNDPSFHDTMGRPRRFEDLRNETASDGTASPCFSP